MDLSYHPDASSRLSEPVIKLFEKQTAQLRHTAVPPFDSLLFHTSYCRWYGNCHTWYLVEYKFNAHCLSFFEKLFLFYYQILRAGIFQSLQWKACGPGVRGIVVWFPAEARIFSPYLPFRLSGPTFLASYSLRTGFLSWGQTGWGVRLSSEPI